MIANETTLHKRRNDRIVDHNRGDNFLYRILKSNNYYKGNQMLRRVQLYTTADVEL